MHSQFVQGFQVGEWTVEPLNGRISRADGQSQHLQPKVMDVLVCLAEHAGMPVTRDELLRCVWGERATTDEPLTRTIAELRRALGDDRAHPRYIETIPKRGYRLVAEVRLPETAGPDEQTTRVAGRRTPLIVMSLMVVAVALFGFFTWWTPAPTERSIAVLPFENMSGDVEQDYFAYGVSEEIVNELSKIQGLKVISRTSAFYFKGKELPVHEIAETLDVAYVLEGSVSRSGDRLRVSAQLIDASSGYHVWANTWDKTLTDVFAIQDEIAAAVVDSLQIELLDEIPTTARTDPEAYALYLKSGPLLWRFTKESMEEASRLLMQALAIDPEYAAAWGRLSINQYHQGLLMWATPNQEEAFARAEASARRALDLDPNEMSALQTLGSAAMFARWDFAEAHVWFSRARDAWPGHASPLNALGNWNSMLGRRDAARALFQQAADLDPLQLVYLGHLAGTNYTVGRFDIARSQIEAMKEIDPESDRVFFHGGWLEWHQGNFEIALLYADRQEGGHVLTACSLYSMGRFLEAEGALENLEPHNPYGVASIYSCWADADNAFEWLERSLEQRSAGMAALRGHFIFEPLHDDPRWQPLLHRVGISDEQVERLGL